MFGPFRELRRTLDRNNELLELNREAFERNSKAFERNSKAFERNSQAFERNSEAFEDLRTFTRELSLRNERFIQAAIEELAQMRDQIRGNTEAVLRVLDRLDNGPASAE